MQILMGVNETIVRIDNEKLYTRNLVIFMQTQFLLYTQRDHHIVLLYHEQEYHKRIYLMKWLYSMYVKTTKYNMPNMKELLVNRIKKPIKVEFKTPITNLNNIKIETQKIEKEIKNKKPSISNELKIAMNILNIKENEEKINIRKKYKTLLKKYHPDVVFNDSEEKIKIYTEKFQEIQFSYSLIMSKKELN